MSERGAPFLLRGAFVRMDDYGLDAVARAVLGEGKALAGRGRAEEILRLFDEDREHRTDARLAQRIAHSLEEDAWSRFAAGWAVEPIACIGAVNRAIAGLRTPARIRRYLEAAVDLETLMDRGTLRAPQRRVLSGIPGYIMDGYTDMGRNPSRTVHRGPEKIRVAACAVTCRSCTSSASRRRRSRRAWSRVPSASSGSRGAMPGTSPGSGALVDVTLPSRHGPLIVVGAS
jgi:hypothetical protein